MKRPRKAVRIGLPVLVIGLLALAALWRVGSPGGSVATNGSQTTTPLGPLTRIAEVAAQNSVGRRASLENVRVRSLPSERTAWIDSGANVGPGTELVFAVLDPDVKRATDLRWQPGARVTLIGIVRPSPAPEQAIRQWQIDDATAAALQTRGTYLHVTEIRN